MRRRNGPKGAIAFASENAGTPRYVDQAYREIASDHELTNLIGQGKHTGDGVVEGGIFGILDKWGAEAADGMSAVRK